MNSGKQDIRSMADMMAKETHYNQIFTVTLGYRGNLTAGFKWQPHEPI